MPRGINDAAPGRQAELRLPDCDPEEKWTNCDTQRGDGSLQQTAAPLVDAFMPRGIRLQRTLLAVVCSGWAHV